MILSKCEIDLLSKGLKFTPTPTFNTNELKSDISAFNRRLRLREYYYDQNTEEDSLVFNPGTFTPPPGRNIELDKFIDYTNNIPIGQNNRKAIRSNLNKNERNALKKLRSRKDIIIKEADKGSAVVIMNKNFYEEKIDELLSEHDRYEEVEGNLDKKCMNKIDKLIQETDSYITRKEKEYLTKFEYKTSQFYGLPKIHKSDIITKSITDQNSHYIQAENPDDLKFRPIVAGPACPSHRLSDLLDKLSRPFIKHVKSYVRDDIDFLNHLPKSIKITDVLITMDVCSLYSNIDHDLGHKAITYWLELHPEDIHDRFTKSFILDAMHIILNNNSFKFGNKQLLQKIGTAMGTKFAPTYATLVLGYLETILYDRIEEKISKDARLLIENNTKRYLDDVFTILDTTLLNKDDLLPIMNTLHPNIQFTAEQSSHDIPFLDIRIIKSGTDIITDIYYKPTDTKQYLSYKSCHPRSTKNNVPFNLARRICTIISDEKLRKERLAELKKSLIGRQYPEGVIDKGIEMASAIDLDILRTPRKKDNNDILPLVATYNPNAPNGVRFIPCHVNQFIMKVG